MSPTRTYLLAAASFGTWHSLASAQTAMTSAVYNPATGHRYVLLTASSWTAAESVAVNLGGHLATVDNQAENDWILNQFGQFDGYEFWIGYRRTTNGGPFSWVSGATTTFTNWYAGEPNNVGGNENYVHLIGYFAERTGFWNDARDTHLYRIGQRGVVELNAQRYWSNATDGYWTANNAWQTDTQHAIQTGTTPYAPTQYEDVVLDATGPYVVTVNSSASARSLQVLTGTLAIDPGASLSITGSSSIAGTVDLKSGGSFTGNLQVSAGGTLAGQGALTGNLTLASNSSLNVTLTGSSYSPITINGTVDLTGAILDLDLLNFTPTIGQTFTILANDGVDPVVGRFGNLTNSNLGWDYFNVGSNYFSVSYTGGSGNDIVLTVIPEPSSAIFLMTLSAGMLTSRRRRA